MKNRISLAFLTAALISGLALTSPALAIKNGLSSPEASFLPATSFFKRLFGGGDEKNTAQALPTDLLEKYQDEFEENSFLHTTKRFEDSTITYEVRIPDDWEHTTADLGLKTDIKQHFLSPLDHFRGELLIGGGRSSLSVQAMTLEHEMLAEHWLQDYIFKNGHTAEEPIQAYNENQAGAEYIFIKNGISYHAFVKIFIIQNRLLMVSFETPLNTAQKSIAFGQLAVNSFAITSSDIGMIEETNDFSFLNALQFTYPKSWTARNHSQSNPHQASIDFQNRSDNQVLNGMVRIKTYRHTQDHDNFQIVQELQENITEGFNLNINQLTHSAAMSVGGAYDVAHIERYDVSQNRSMTSEYEIWIATLATEEWTTFIFLLTPNQSLDFYNWARNTRMLDLMLDSMT